MRKTSLLSISPDAMKIKGKKILITGGSGFIGSNLVNKLEKLGARVFNYDISKNYDILDKKKTFFCSFQKIRYNISSCRLVWQCN